MANRYQTQFDDDEGPQGKRAESTYRKLKGSTCWAMTPQAAGRLVREQFAPNYLEPPFYIPVGNEVKILKDLIHDGMPVVLTGPPGIGKTTLIQAVFYELGIPLQTFVASAATQASELLGRLGTGGDKGELSVWVDGKLSLAARAAEGGLVNGVYLDEVINLPGNVASCMYSVLDNRHSLPLPTGEEVQVGQALKMVFSYNPSRTVRLDDAMRSRLAAIRIGYPPEAVESQLLMDKRRGLLHRIEKGSEVASGMARFANTIRSACGADVGGDMVKLSREEEQTLRRLPAPPSTRNLIVAARMVATWNYTGAEALKLFVIPSVIQDTHDSDAAALILLLNQLADEILEKSDNARGFTTGMIPRQMRHEESRQLRVADRKYVDEVRKPAEKKPKDPELDTKALAAEIVRNFRMTK